MSRKIEWLMAAVLATSLGAATWLQPKPGAKTPAAAVAAQMASPSANSFVVKNARVFDGETLLPRATVVVRAGLITAVLANETDSAKASAGLSVIDGAGKTLMPGLIDAHTHSWGNAQREALRFGVTTELEMMGDATLMPAHKAQRESLAQTDQADLWSAGYAVTVPGGHGTQFGLKVPTLPPGTDAQAFVQARLSEGSDYIKLIVEDLSAFGGKTRWPTLNAMQVSTAIAAAHAAGKMALVHVSRLDAATAVLQAGANGLVHVFGDAPIDAKFLAIASARKAFVVPTLSVLAGFAGGTSANLADDAALAQFLSSSQRYSLRVQRPGAARPEILRTAISNVRQLHDAGVVILAGTDAGNPGTAHGASMHGELALLVQSGLSPQQALMAATSKPAQAFGLADRGRIKAGMRADLLLVEGDPLVDINATRQIASVWKNGFAVARSISVDRAAVIADGSLLGAFDEPAVKLIRAPFGRWSDTSDQMAGGASSANVAQTAGGANATPGALHVQGQMRTGFAYPWAGTMFMAGNAMEPVDAANKTELVFHVRGDGREYRVMLFSGENAQGIPATLPFKTTPAWQEIRLPLADFAGAELATLRGFAWAADMPEGKFEFWLDEVSLR
jgi:imidazolonepropionase-like amidohydrolase